MIITRDYVCNENEECWGICHEWKYIWYRKDFHTVVWLITIITQVSDQTVQDDLTCWEQYVTHVLCQPICNVLDS